MRKYCLAILIISSALVTSCSIMPVYKIDRQQGNIIDQKKVNQLKPGMSVQEVLYLMGTPVLEQGIDPKRLDYVYTFKPGGKPLQEKRISLFFVGNRLQSINGTVHPGMAGSNNSPTAQQMTKQDTNSPAPVTSNPAAKPRNTIPKPY